MSKAAIDCAAWDFSRIEHDYINNGFQVTVYQLCLASTLHLLPVIVERFLP